MKENFYEAELRKVLRKEMESHLVREVGDSSHFFAGLMETYPARGSKIDWCRVPGSIERAEEDESVQVEKFTAFFDEIAHKFHLAGDVVYVGDSATDFALTGSLECMRGALPELLSIPQHHYLIGAGSSWCFCFTMEGGMGFGFSPATANEDLDTHN
jgi:hypothetical protein